MILTYSIGFGDIITFLIGFLVGSIAGVVLFIKNRKKKFNKRMEPKYGLINEDDKVMIEKYINNVYHYHIATRKDTKKYLFGIIQIKQKLDYKSLYENYLDLNYNPDKEKLTIPEELLWLINAVAKESYPNSKYPLLELSIDDIFELINELIDLVDKLIDDIGIPNLKKLSIHFIYDAAIYGTKFFEIYKKPATRIIWGLINAAIKIQSVINPIYWIKKGTSAVSTESMIQLLYEIMFEMTGKVTAYVYYHNEIEQQELKKLQEQETE